MGGKDLNFYVEPQAPITNKSTSEEEKTFGKAPMVGGRTKKCSKALVRGSHPPQT